MLIDCVIGFAIAFVVAFVSTPFVRKLAIKVGAIDVPTDDRRMHKSPIPRMGGLAIFIGIMAAILYSLISSQIENSGTIFDSRIIGYVIGAAIIVVMGIFDDIKPIRAIYKLFIQVLAASVAVGFGITIGHIANPFEAESYFHLGLLEIPLTILWIVGITNAINFIDGLDGLATGITCISSAALLFIFLITGQSIGAIFIAAIMVGATMGFLPFNFNPAKIFMGDTGSNFLGFSLAIISILGLAKTYTIISVLVPIIILAVPIFDTGFAIIRRIINKQSPMVADKGHIHHRLIEAGLSTRQAVFVLYAVCALLGMLAIVLVESSLWKVIILIIAILIFMYAGIRYLGSEELKQIDKLPTANEKDKE